MAYLHLEHKIKTNAHNRAQITSIIDNPYTEGQILTASYDGLIVRWKQQDLSMVRYMIIPDPYPSCVVAWNGRFLVGIGSGKVLEVVADLSAVCRQYHVHQDCVTGIIVQQHTIITASLDGYIHILNNPTLQKQHTVNVQVPVFRTTLHNNNLYISSNPSYELDLSTWQKKKLPHYKQFLVHDEVVYGCSDEVGITCLKTKYKTYVPAHYIVSVGRYIVFFGHNAIGYFQHDKDVEISWYMQLSRCLESGFIMLNSLVKGKYVYMVEESGHMYKFAIQNYKNKEQLMSSITNTKQENNKLEKIKQEQNTA